MNINITNWLDSKISDTDAISHYISQYERDTYYNTNDVDEQKKDIPDEEKKYIDHMYIEPDTKRYHANMLFRRLLDYSIDNNFTYNIYDEENNDYEWCDLIDKTLKESFYKFCYENSVRPMSK